MSALFLRAMKKIPDHFVDDDTRTCEFRGVIYICNPKYPVMMFSDAVGFFQTVEFQQDIPAK